MRGSNVTIIGMVLLVMLLTSCRSKKVRNGTWIGNHGNYRTTVQ